MRAEGIGVHFEVFVHDELLEREEGEGDVRLHVPPVLPRDGFRHAREELLQVVLFRQVREVWKVG